MTNISPNKIVETNSENECLELSEDLCNERYSTVPEIGIGVLFPQNRIESSFNWIVERIPILAAALMLSISLMITLDVTGRLIFNKPIVGITDLEILFMGIVGFSCMAFAVIQRQNLQIDIFYNIASQKIKRVLNLFSHLLALLISGTLGYLSFETSLNWQRFTSILEINEWPFFLITGLSLLLVSIAFLFQVIHSVKSMLAHKEYFGIACAFILAVTIISLPFVYKIFGLKFSGLALGSFGFLLLMTLLLMRVPLGFAMSLVGLLGLLAVVRQYTTAFNTVSVIPFTSTSNLTIIAFPMFMLMGEMVALSGLSQDLFNAAEKWFGRLPGGLAVSSVGGCAGFGAVCGDSMATVVTMTSVALPAMEKNNYNQSLSTGSLAAGGTLGILIPPSIGFIVYSMITEESVGKLFIAGLLPGILLTIIFMLIIVVQAKRHPDWAPKTQAYSLQEKLMSLVYIIPVVVLFLIVVVGILYGWFTPAEGGAVGAVLSFTYALVRRKITLKGFMQTLYRSTGMFGKMWALFVGLYVLGTFLSMSRLPLSLSSAVTSLEVNRYIVLLAIILLYVVLGCVMNIIPMMMLTLPSIYPTVQALGFDGIWFGVVCVIVMEMGMITPPVGMNVFTLAGLRPDIPSSTIFKGVLPFFLGMLICVALIIIFPQIVLVLV